MRKISDKHKRYADMVLNGYTKREAYKSVYPNADDNSIDTCSQRLEKREEVREYIEAKRKEIDQRATEKTLEFLDKALWTREEAINDLRMIIECAKEDIANKKAWNKEHQLDDNYKYMPVMPTSASKPITDAIQMLNDMHGFSQIDKNTNEAVTLTNLFIEATDFNDDNEGEK